MSLLDVVTLINKNPDGAIQRGQFGEAGQPGRAGERWKISVELNRSSLTVQTLTRDHPRYSRRTMPGQRGFPRGRGSSRRQDL